MVSTLEVVMRPPEVFVRELSPEEGARLKRISQRAKYQCKRQRAMIVLASSTGMSRNLSRNFSHPSRSSGL